MQSPLRLRGTLSVLMLGFGATISCSDRPAQPPPSGAGPGDAAFTELARQILDDHHKRHPSAATDLGLHQYDAELEDASEAAIHAESQALQQFRTKLAAIDAATLTTDRQLEREHAGVERALHPLARARPDPAQRRGTQLGQPRDDPTSNAAPGAQQHTTGRAHNASQS